MSTNNWAHAYLFTESNQRGREIEMNPRRAQQGHRELLIHPTQSVQVNPARYYDNKLILFDGMPSSPPVPYRGYNQHLPYNVTLPAFGDYQGKFIMVHNRKRDGSGPVRFDINAHTWAQTNRVGFGRPSSALLVRARRRPEFRWWLKRIIPFVWDRLFELVLSQMNVPWPVGVSPDPVEISWIAFPEGVAQLQDSRMYIVVHQGLKVDVVLRNVQCGLNAYLEVGVDDHGRFQVSRAKSDFYYAKGFEGHRIENALKGAMSAWDAVFDVGAGLFNFFSDIPAQRAYLLPGAQDGLSMKDGIVTGNVNRDGITLVVEPPASTTQTVSMNRTKVADELKKLVRKFQDLLGNLWGGPAIMVNVHSGNGNQVINQSVTDLDYAYRYPGSAPK